MTEEVTRLRELNRKRNLPERDQLNKQLIAATQTLQEKEKEVEVRISGDKGRMYGVQREVDKKEINATATLYRKASR